MKRTLLDYSNSKKYIIDNYKDDLNIIDSILVDAQQMIESLLKYSLLIKFGRYEETHSIQQLAKYLDVDLYRRNRELASELTQIYYAMGCSSLVYKEYSIDEYYKLLENTNNFRNDILNLVE